MTVEHPARKPRRCPRCMDPVFEVDGRLVNQGGTPHTCSGLLEKR